MAAIAKRELDVPHAAGDRSLTGRRVSQSSVRDALLLALTFSSGAVDAISYLALGKIFTAFMTGNLVFLGFGLAGAGVVRVLRVAVSLAAFAMGVFVAARIGRASKGSRIWPSRVSIALAVGVLAETAFLAGWLATSGRPSTDASELLVAVVAFAMGIQSGAVTSLAVEGVFTTAATASLVFLMSDVAAWTDSAVERRRLAAVVGAVVAGAASGALLILHARPYAPILPLVGTVLVIATASVALRRPRSSEIPSVRHFSRQQAPRNAGQQ